jgi:hypothetical protein
MTTALELQAEIARLQEKYRIAQNGLASLNKNLQSNQAILARYANEVATIPGQIAALEARLSALQAQPQSAATDVANSANSATQNPRTAPTSTGRLTTDQAATLASNTETGTNAPVKTLITTQSVNPETGELYTALSEGRPGGEPGVGAKGEDGTTAANTRQIISAATARQTVFQPRNNVLDQYASYTYNIGWYLMTPAQYTAQQKQQKIAVSQYNLLVQSGGAPAGTAGVQPDLTTTGTVAGTTQTAGRNPFFGLDYYFDNLEIKSTVSGKGTTRGHNVASLSFTVTEPAAITLIDNLYSAVNSVYKTIETETVNNVQLVVAYYALVIRFYGYDQNGKIVQASDSDNKNAVVEKIIPFKLTNISFTVTNKLVEYLVEGVAIPYDVGFGSNLGVIKSQIEITGATVKDLLTKGAAAAEVSPTDGRTSTPAPVKVGDLPVKEQAAIAAGTDSNLVNDDGMAFGGGGL